MAKKGFLEGYKTYDTSHGFGSSSQWKSAFEERMNLGVVKNSDRLQYKHIVEKLFSIKNADELKKAYYKLMMIHHPDKAGDTDENKIIAQYINDVYFELKEKL
jgi:DnaJ-domain-containing protein 1